MKQFDLEGYVFDNLKNVKKGSTGQIAAICPWCEKYGSFYIDSITGDYICFKCENKGRKLVGIISKIENISWQQAIDFLIKKSEVTRRKYEFSDLAERISNLRNHDTQSSVDIQNVINLPNEYIPVFKNGKWKYPLYLKERGIFRDTARQFELGFCNSGRYKNRIIIPINCINGRSFTSRTIIRNVIPKYLNPACSYKRTLLHGWNLVDKNEDLVLVEGPIDAIKMRQHGFNVVSLGGKVLHSEQIGMLLKIDNDASITIMLDPEEETAPFAIAEQLKLLFKNLYIAKLPNGIDPGSSTKEQAEEAIYNSSKYIGNRYGELYFNSIKNRLNKC